MSRIISLFISQDGIRFLEKAIEEKKEAKGVEVESVKFPPGRPRLSPAYQSK